MAAAYVAVAAPNARKVMEIDAETIGQASGQLLRQFVETMNTLLKLPRAIERILVKLKAGQFVINLGGDIGIGATAFLRREKNGASTSFPVALPLMFVACLGTAAFFLHYHDEILAIAALGLAAFLGLGCFSVVSKK